MTKCICGVEISPDNVGDHQGCGTKMYNEERRDTTPEQADIEMQAIVESVPGGCWHKPEPHKHFARCLRCDGVHIDNPSPTDLNAISEYENKLGYRVKVAQYSDGFYVWLASGGQMIDKEDYLIAQEAAEVEARRKALYAAIKEV